MAKLKLSLGLIPSTSKIEQEENALIEEFEKLKKFSESDELKRFNELESRVNSTDFKTKKEHIVNLRFKDSEEYNKELEFRKLDKDSSLALYFKTRDSVDLKKFRELENSEKIKRYEELSKTVSSVAFKEKQKMKPITFKTTEEYNKYREFRRLNSDSNIKSYKKLLQKGQKEEAEKLESVPSIKRYRELKEFVNSPAFLEKKNMKPITFRDTDEYRLLQEYKKLKNDPDIKFFYKFRSSKALSNFKELDGSQKVSRHAELKNYLNTDEFRERKAYLLDKKRFEKSDLYKEEEQYEKLKKSNAHADAFKILHLFYDSLEKIVISPKTLEEEKAILFPAVEQFNSFKLMLGSTIEAEAIKRDEKEAEDEKVPADSSFVTPAFADIPEEEVKGFQAEEEARALGVENSDDIIDDHIDNFFTGSDFETVEESIHTDQPDSTVGELSEAGIQGVDVEIDDEEEGESPLPASDGPAPALSFADDDSDATEPAPALQTEEFSAKQESLSRVEKDDEKPGLDFSKLDKDIVLQGVEVETEADDDSDEEALPMMGGELAPALAENDETSIYNAEIFESSIEENVEAEISGTLGGFFDEEIESHVTVDAQSETEPSSEEETTIASSEEAGLEPTAAIEDEEETVAFVSQPKEDDPAEEGFVADGDPAPVTEDVAEIDEHLDSFFGFEEGVEELADDKLLYSEPDEPSDNNISDEEVVFPALEDTEEEVVFELVEEDESAFSSVSPEGISGDEFSKEFTLTPEIDSVTAVYQPLRTSVEALGPGFEDKIIGDVWAEIDRLNEELSDRPLERTFLHLLSTLIRHIDRNRHAVNSDAFALLKSVCNALTQLDDSKSQKNQQMLLTETGKVLDWQEGLLVQPMVKQ